MFKKLVLVFCMLFALVSLAGCGGTQESSSSDSSSSQAESSADKVQVAVSFNAMKEFVEAVGKDKVEVHTIIPDGTEPHDFEPTAKDLTSLKNAKVFVYNGLGMEPWAEKAVSAADNKDLISVEATKGIDLITNDDPEEVKEHGQYDPHAWLSLKNAQVEVKNIADALAQADPNNADFYKSNSDAYIKQLEDLYDEYNQKIQAEPNKNIVTGHAAFAYFCRDFGLKQNSVEDTFAEGEPSAQQLATLVQYCKDNNVKIIFAEEMASPSVSKTLADEVGAKVETIYTIEGNEDNLSYLDRMKSNLDKVYESLK